MTNEADTTGGKKIGRPKKTKNPVGRPKGEGAIMKEYRQRMLNSPQSRKVLQSVFDVAQDTEHKHWPAAMKTIMDRILPSSGFEKEAGSLQRASIQVNITGVDGVELKGSDDSIVDEQ
jgi:hypothetical protein